MSVLSIAPASSEGLRLASLLGYAGFFFLAATVVLGIARAVDRPGARLGGAALEQIHLACAVAGVAGVAGHITAHLVREHGGYSITAALIPFVGSDWVVATGIFAWLLLVLVLAGVPLRAVLGYGGWLTVHRLAYGAALLMSVHVVAASDEVARVELAGVAVVVGVVAMLFASRRRLRGSEIFEHGSGTQRRHRW